MLDIIMATQEKKKHPPSGSETDAPGTRLSNVSEGNFRCQVSHLIFLTFGACSWLMEKDFC